MKLKLVMIFIGVVLILLMFGLELVQGEDVGYPAPIEQVLDNPVNYPAPGYPVYEVDSSIPNYPEPEASSPEIELSSITYQLEPIAPQYVNGRNLWQEIVFQFAKLLELMK